MAQALVRVGNSSNIKFNEISAIRAITLSDVSAVLSTKSFEFVVFEGVQDTEIEAIKELRKDFRVPMYTFGNLVIDGIENHISLSDLQDAIDGTTGMWVRTYGITRSPILWDKQYDEHGNEIPMLKADDEALELTEPTETPTIHEVAEVSIESSETSEEAEQETSKQEETEALSTLPAIEDKGEAYKMINSLIEEVTFYKGLLDSINNSAVSAEVEEQLNKQKGLLEEIEALRAENENLAVSKATLDIQCSDLSDSIEKLEQQVASKEDGQSTLNEALEENHKQLDNLRGLLLKATTSALDILSTLSDEQDKNADLMVQYSSLLEEKALLLVDVQTKSEENAHLSRQFSEYKRTADMQMEAVVTAKTTLSTQLSDLRVENGTVALELQEANAQLKHLTALQESKTNQIENMENELLELNQQLSEKSQEVQSLNDTLLQYEEQVQDRNAKSSEIEALNRTILTMQQEVGNLQLRLSETQNELKRAEDRTGELQKARDEAEITAKSYERRLKTGTGASLNCNYSGHAQILPVFGIGSHGITTTAVSIATKLNKAGKSVCVLDLDLVNPKANSFFKDISPLADLADNYGLNKTEQSCMGALMENGVPWFVEHRHEFISTVQENRQKGGKRLDYFSGLYAPINMVRLIALDYTELINVLGNDYDYLIVDLGKIGASDVQDTLIRMFYRIGLRTTVVCTKEMDSLRNMILKMQINKLDIKNCVWLLNMAKDNGETQFIKHSLKGIPYKVIVFNNAIFGCNQTFTSGLLRGAFDEFVEDLLLGGTGNGK